MILKRIPFVVPSGWIEAIFAAAEGMVPDADVLVHRECFKAVSFVLGHGVLMNPISYPDFVKYMEEPDSLLDRLSRLRGEAWPKGLLKSAKFAGAALPNLRVSGVRLRSQSALTRAFEAPASDVMRRELKNLQHEFDRSSRNPAMYAFAFYFVLLTLHPLPDGNGRLARTSFAALLWSAGCVNPIYIVALARCFESGGDAFQVAAHRTRSGDHLAILDHYRFAVQRAACHTTEIDQLCRLLDAHDFRGAHQVLDSIRAFLCQITGS